jgi:arylsulfatase A-like enzyme
MSDHQSPGKFSLYEDGAHVPLFVRWPAAISPDSESDAVVANVDILPTLAEICGADVPPDHAVDGLSFAATLRDPEQTAGREALYLEISNTRGIVTADGWKYIALRFGAESQALIDGGKRLSHWGQDMETATHTYGVDTRHPGYFDADQLYNLEEDPGEERNLAADPAHAERLAAMKRMLREHMASVPFRFGEFQEAAG